jgi:Fe-S cluster biogenesis protein NfuA
MFIQTEETPNPATLKFIPGRTVMETGTADFPDAKSAWRSPLAQKLFTLPGVRSVFLGSDFIAVTKHEEANWLTLKPFILTSIMEYFLTHTTAQVTPAEPTGSSSETGEIGEEDAITQEIKELLETRIRPAVAQDGGDIIFDRFENGIVYVRLQGACSGCPSSLMTLKTGIENMLRYYIPEVQEVQAVD